MDDRTVKVIGENALQKLKNENILLIGLGGVGGYVFEALVRSGICSFTLVDSDFFEISNLNRQVLATHDTLGICKVSVAELRAFSINPNIKVRKIHKKIDPSFITEEFLNSFSFVIDACDTVSVKLELIRKCSLLSIPIISSMGSANRVCAQCVEVMPLRKTFNDPLAKVLRHELRYERKLLNTMVVCSTETPIKQKELGTICPVPMSFGAVMASYVIQYILHH